MRRPTSAWTTAILGTALTASTLSAQQVATPAPGAGVGAGQAAAPARTGLSARYALRNGWDYLKLRQYDRALALFREAQKQQAGLSPEELRSLQQGIDGARQALHKVPVDAMVKTASAATALLASAAVPAQVAAPGSTPALAGPGETPALQPVDAKQLVATPALQPVDAREATPVPSDPAMPALPPLGADAPAAPPLAPVEAVNEPAPAPAPVEVPAAAPAGADSLPPLPDTPPLPAAPPVAPPAADRDVREVQLSERPAAVPVPVPEPVPPLPDSLAGALESAPAPLAPAPLSEVPQVAAAPAEALAPAPAAPVVVPAPAPAAEPAPTPMPVVEPSAGPVIEPPPAPAATLAPAAAPATAPAPAPAAAMAAVDADADADADRPQTRLRPDLRRQVEEIALQQEEEARQRGQQPAQMRPAPDSGPVPGSPASRLELTRAPSPTEARPIRAIPVPEEFVPLPKRDWAPNRKMWAAAATAHHPLYFQDAALERYGHSVEQTVGPIGRYLSYPLDDPKQSNQRNQLTQWLFSYGLFAAQIVALPYNLVMDPPWECEYDLGYYRPGDRVPTDIYYLPVTGVGPPLRGARY